jgi:nitroreductase
MDVIEAIHSRRSIRAFDPRPVERHLVEEIIWDAAQAPPPFSGQVPWVFNVLEGIERIDGYGQRAKAHAARVHAGEPGSSWTERVDFQVFWGAPAVVIISGRTEDCCRAGQNLMLSAHARGLGTCWVGSAMTWLRDAGVKAELGLPADLEPVAALCLGYPRLIPPAPPRERPPILWSNARPKASA